MFDVNHPATRRDDCRFLSVWDDDPKNRIRLRLWPGRFTVSNNNGQLANQLLLLDSLEELDKRGASATLGSIIGMGRSGVDS